MCAATSGHLSTVKLLVSEGANVYEQVLIYWTKLVIKETELLQ